MRASWPRTRIEYTVTLEHTVIILYYLKATTALRKLRSFALLAKTFCPLGGEDPAMRESPILLCVCVRARVRAMLVPHLQDALVTLEQRYHVAIRGPQGSDLGKGSRVGARRRMRTVSVERAHRREDRLAHSSQRSPFRKLGTEWDRRGALRARSAS